MPDDDAARAERARALREAIARLEETGADLPADALDQAAAQEPLPGESIHEFVQRRMRELRHKKGAQGAAKDSQDHPE